MSRTGLAVDARVDERAARATLKAQVGRLEHELSLIVAVWFPHVKPNVSGSPARRLDVPRLLDLGELERERDELAEQVRVARAQARERAQRERRARELLADMQRDPRRHKFMRIAVADLGEGGCGAWHVRPRLGLIGMLAGWWQVKLSSGCP